MSSNDLILLLVCFTEVGLLMWSQWPDKHEVAIRRYLTSICILLAMLIMIVATFANHVETKGVVVVTPTVESAK